MASTSSFAPSHTKRSPVAPIAATRIREEVDTLGNNIVVKNLLEDVESSGLLSEVAKSGLLSKAQAAGLSLSKLEPLLADAAGNKEILVLVEAATPEVLPLLPKVVELAPQALPFLATAITVPPATFSAAGLVSLAIAAGAIVVIPDDTLLQVAEQTFTAGALGFVGIASLVGSTVLGKVVK